MENFYNIKRKELIKNGIDAICFIYLEVKLTKELLYKNIYAYNSV